MPKPPPSFGRAFLRLPISWADPTDSGLRDLLPTADDDTIRFAGIVLPMLLDARDAPRKALTTSRIAALLRMREDTVRQRLRPLVSCGLVRSDRQNKSDPRIRWHKLTGAGYRLTHRATATYFKLTYARLHHLQRPRPLSIWLEAVAEDARRSHQPLRASEVARMLAASRNTVKTHLRLYAIPDSPASAEANPGIYFIAQTEAQRDEFLALYRESHVEGDTPVYVNGVLTFLVTEDGTLYDEAGAAGLRVIQAA
jgi:hypothetical protein